MTLRIAAAAIMAAVVTVFTAVVQVPNPASGGYFNLSDVAVIFAAVIASLSLMAFQNRRSCSRTSWVLVVVVMEASSRDSVIPLPAPARNVVRAFRRDKHNRTAIRASDSDRRSRSWRAAAY